MLAATVLRASRPVPLLRVVNGAGAARLACSRAGAMAEVRAASAPLLTRTPAKPSAGPAPVTRSLVARLLSTATVAGVEVPRTKYSSPMVLLHWLIAAGFLTCIGTVKLAQWTPKENPKKYGYSKGELMMIHKSTAVLVAALVVPRVALRLFQKQPPPPPGGAIEHGLAKLSHFYFYAMMIALPGSGMAMGYFGGKGIPFFGSTLAVADEPNKDVASTAFKAHKQMGQIIQYVIPIHVGAVAWHALKGQNILARIWF
ncbi:Hypothetical Protein FCC1311_073112 [Hondaea fermentalgiana]|uniref:Cytochrome b561 bacterial/Ni-hydrogenase domain-containing protein n=1 Tax=Hondaea fermentalgiana TaxID=2315210 RepID=A0A2R5GJN3_9STRA|nr:Hypothetical Protein FCC1311_073112 [Hondaea fermentalgiana]|eukprot:GBG31090.1 Hypothetical Protein FCC1311_073112 [Hondaea fermentalgiana]